jgi:hypothetical protein
MKKLLFIAMIIASVAVKAQSTYPVIIPILMGDSVVFDLTEYPFDDITLSLNKMDNYGGHDDELYLDMILQFKAASILTNSWKIYGTNYASPYFFPTNAYFPISIGDKYSVSYYFPDSFHYKHYYNYYLNYNSIFIHICAISGDGEIMGTFKVAQMPISVSMVPDMSQNPYLPFQYWDCQGIGGTDDIMYYNNGELTAHRIQPTVDFTDLWYTEYDLGIPNWTQHSAFVAEIDHFAIGLGFGN